MTGYRPETLGRAKSLRRTLTDAEQLLWKHVRASALGVRFRRQQPIGSYIVDFACMAHHLVIEVDGGQHAQSDSDLRRDAWLEEQGYQILRFWNHDVLNNLQGVLETITAALNAPHPPTAMRRAPPSPSRGEGISDGDIRV